MKKDYLILKRALVSSRAASVDVLANGELVGRIFKANAAPVGSPMVVGLTATLQGARARWLPSPKAGEKE
jgi:hypothetical protein